MSGAAIINYVLSQNAPLTAVVSGTKIIAGMVPLNVELPAISIRQISGAERESIKRTGTRTVTDRVQVAALASTYAQQKQIIELIRNAVTSSRTTTNTFQVDSISHDIDGPDLYSEEPVTFEQSIDFIVRFYR